MNQYPLLQVEISKLLDPIMVMPNSLIKTIITNILQLLYKINITILS